MGEAVVAPISRRSAWAGSASATGWRPRPACGDVGRASRSGRGRRSSGPVVGLLVDNFGHADAFAMFAAIGISVALLSPMYPGHIQDAGDQADADTGLQAAYDYQLVGPEGEPLHSATVEAKTT